MVSSVNEGKSSMKNASIVAIMETLKAVDEYIENPCPVTEDKYERRWNKFKNSEKHMKKNKPK